MVTQVLNTSSNWSSMREMHDYNEDMVMTAKSLLFDSSSPNDDMWRKFALPLTPPRSPTRSLGESTECNDTTTEDIANRLQDVCDSLDSAFDIGSCVLPDSKYLRSRLISDCMWSGSHSEDKRIPQTISIVQPKLSIAIETEEDLYPTPCASPIPHVPEDVTDYPSSTDCVDPTTVFPLPPQDKNSMLSNQSDTDEEIDVVTVDNIPSTPSPITVGMKRKQISNTIILAKVQTSHSPPSLKRAKSAPSKVILEKERISARRAISCADDSDPETKRATHNVLERKRRIDLKKSFERLRECVPNLEKIDKTPKVIVLKKAAMHIEDLNRQEVELQEQKNHLSNENEELTRKIELLRAALNIQ